MDSDGKMEVCNIDRYSVGRNISTKAVDGPYRHDLTYDYKYRDGKFMYCVCGYFRLSYSLQI